MIYLQTGKWFQALLCNTNNSALVICLHIVKWLNSSVWSIDSTQTGTTTPGQNGSGSNGNEGVFHIPQRSRSGDGLLFRTRSLVGWLVVLFYGVSTLFRPFNAEFSHREKSFKQFILA